MSNYTKIKKIKILSPNAKLKQLILENYPSIDQFAKEIDIYPSTLKQYLRSSKLGSDKFKIQIALKLDLDIQLLYQSYADQISAYVYEVNKHIRHYNTSDDLEILKTLSEQTLKNNLYTEHFIVIYDLGRFEYFRGNYELALRHFNNAQSYFRAESEVCFSLEILLYKAKTYAKQLHFKMKSAVDKSLVLNTLDDASKLFCCLNDNPLNLEYRYYQITGYVYTLIDEYNLAYTAFNMALVYGKTSHEKIHSLIYIGYCESMNGNLDKSLEYYSEIMKLPIEGSPVLDWIYLNISNIYLRKKDFGMMEIYLSMVKPESCFKLANGFYYYYWNRFIPLKENNLGDEALKLFEQLLNSFMLTTVNLRDKIQVINMLKAITTDVDSSCWILPKLEILIATYLQKEGTFDEVLVDELISLLGIIRLKTLHSEIRSN